LPEIPHTHPDPAVFIDRAGGPEVDFDDEAFAHTDIVNFSFTRDIRSLGKGCLSHCHRLSAVSFCRKPLFRLFEESLFAFSAISEIKVPATILTLKRKCFFGCKQLKSVTFVSPSQLEAIEAFAFSESDLKTITFPPRLRTLDPRALDRTLFGSIKIDPANKHLAIQGKTIVNPETMTLIRHFGKDAVVTVDRKIRILGSHCFASWRDTPGGSPRKVEQIRFVAGSELVEIEDFACTECAFGRIVLPGKIQKMGMRAFATTCHVAVTGADWSQWNRQRLEVLDSGETEKL
jgi:hypothetical protein